jgi:hypothetical protein
VHSECHQVGERREYMYILCMHSILNKTQCFFPMQFLFVCECNSSCALYDYAMSPIQDACIIFFTPKRLHKLGLPPAVCLFYRRRVWVTSQGANQERQLVFKRRNVNKKGGQSSVKPELPPLARIMEASIKAKKQHLVSRRRQCRVLYKGGSPFGRSLPILL